MDTTKDNRGWTQVLAKGMWTIRFIIFINVFCFQTEVFLLTEGYLMISPPHNLLDYRQSYIFTFTFRVPCCNICYDFLINTMFGSFLPPVACLRTYVLFTLCCSLVVSNSNCVVFIVVLLQVSRDCPSLIAPSVFSNVYLHWKYSLLILLMYIFFLPLNRTSHLWGNRNRHYNTELWR
jgi:hypothetical protein